MSNNPDKLITHINAIKKLVPKIPTFVAASAERMKDANFSAQGFIANGTAKRWKARNKETRRTEGKRILHSTGLMQNSVRTTVNGRTTTIGIDGGKVPYAKLHNNGGRVVQHVRPHHRKHPKTGKRHQVRGFARKISMPQRQFLGFSPDILEGARRDIKNELERILKQ